MTAMVARLTDSQPPPAVLIPEPTAAERDAAIEARCERDYQRVHRTMADRFEEARRLRASATHVA